MELRNFLCLMHGWKLCDHTCGQLITQGSYWKILVTICFLLSLLTMLSLEKSHHTCKYCRWDPQKGGTYILSVAYSTPAAISFIFVCLVCFCKFELVLVSKGINKPTCISECFLTGQGPSSIHLVCHWLTYSNRKMLILMLGSWHWKLEVLT